MTYDAASRLSTVTKGSTSSEFTYDGANMIAEYNASNNALKTRYVHGPGVDEPIVLYEHTTLTNFTRSWYVTDQKGSITGLTTSSGTSVATNSYSHYGQPDENNVGRYGYTGQVWIEELDLYYYKARFYDPVIKRFLNTDPIGYGDGMNMYAYVGGDPVNRRDPSGISRGLINSLNGLIRRDGHDYETFNVVCSDSSLLSGDQQKELLANFAVPRAIGRSVRVPPEGGRFEVQEPFTGFGFDGGLVDSVVSNNGFTITNTTVAGQHVFEGEIVRSLIDVNGQLVLHTHGTGNAQFRDLGTARDTGNQYGGIAIFNTYDRLAAEITALAFPGCAAE